MSQIALVMVLIFILASLWDDQKNSANSSLALWIPVAWLGIAASKAASAWLRPNAFIADSSEIDYLSGSPVDRNIFLLLLLVGFLVLLKRRSVINIRVKQNIWIFAFYIYALFSISWSHFPTVSAKRWIKGIGDIIIALVILTEQNKDDALDRVLHRLSIILLPISALLIRYFRTIGVYYDPSGESFAWRGVSDHKNGLGVLCAFLGVYLFWRVLNKKQSKLSKYIDVILILVSVWLLWGANSATSKVVFMIGVITLIAARLLRARKQLLKTGVVVAVILIIAIEGFSTVVFGVSSWSLVFSATGRDSTFTGRAPLWGEMIKIGLQRPVLGAGYGGFWIGNLTHKLWTSFDWKPTNSHNGYIDVFIDLGLFGIIIVIQIILKAFRLFARKFTDNLPISTLFLAFLSMIVIHNITESTLGRAISFLWILLLIMALEVPARAARLGE